MGTLRQCAMRNRTMRERIMRQGAWCLVLVTVWLVQGCRSSRETRPYREPPPDGIQSTEIDYVDTDGFDVLFESSLINQDPVITIRTPNERPDWTGRLNAWIAAWNQGGRVKARVTRGQIPGLAPVSVDGETLREFRLLINSIVDRAEDASKATVAWYNEDRMRSKRVTMLRTYNLRFHMHTDGKIHLIFFNGDYAHHYDDFMHSLMETHEEGPWTRQIECSMCPKYREASRRRELSSRGN